MFCGCFTTALLRYVTTDNINVPRASGVPFHKRHLQLGTGINDMPKHNTRCSFQLVHVCYKIMKLFDLLLYLTLSTRQRMRQGNWTETELCIHTWSHCGHFLFSDGSRWKKKTANTEVTGTQTLVRWSAIHLANVKCCWYRQISFDSWSCS